MEKHSNILKGGIINDHQDLQEKYKNEVVQAMMEKFGYKNVMEVPKLEKIVINMGVGEAKDNPKILEAAVSDLAINHRTKSLY